MLFSDSLASPSTDSLPSSVGHERHTISQSTPWHPVQQTSSYGLWELPSYYSSRPITFDDEENSTEEYIGDNNESQPQNGSSAVVDGWSLFPWSIQPQSSFFASPNGNSYESGRQRLNSFSSENSVPSLAQSSVSTATTVSSVSERRYGGQTRRKHALGDATNTAPVLRVPRSRFL